MLRPYQDPSSTEGGGWEEFAPRIAAALEAYRKVVEPNGINRVGVRYINQIAMPGLTSGLRSISNALIWRWGACPNIT